MPYLFLKPARGVVVGNGQPVVLPYGRDRIDWEVELGTVIGRAAKYVSATDAEDYVFGYLVTMDISDRGGRPPGGNLQLPRVFVQNWERDEFRARLTRVLTGADPTLPSQVVPE